MKQYIIRRLLMMIPTLFGVSIIIFFLFALTPGDYVDSNMKLSPERAHELKVLYGLDKPVLERYFIWIGHVLTGDFGISLQYKAPVTSVINQYLWNSFIIAFAALILTWCIAMVIGVLSAVKQYSWFDALVSFGVFAAMSFPSFFVCLLLVKYLALDLKLFPVGGMLATGSNAVGWDYIWEVAYHMILPVTVLTMLSVGSLTRYFRTSMLDVIKQDFVRTARAKGLKEKTVVFKHALRNALLPAITLLGFELPGLFGGAIITETIFNWPGIGRLNLEALGYRDYPVLMGFTMLLAVLTILGNLLADILYAAADPRVRLK
ncbi:ABC transporter permease [Brevibacillus ginsengisoli]|uniref:ABC transporter permease n=1 Tax=Brevibacillus ginsengisoli TaxID=363854 RepID=UPI003CF87E8B